MKTTLRLIITAAGLMLGLVAHARDVHDTDRVVVGSDSHIAAGETAPNDAVVIRGNLTVDGKVCHDGVAVLGSVGVNGSVDHDVVAVLGDVTVNGTVGHDVVSVGGNITLGPSAHVLGEFVCVGGGKVIHSDSVAIVNQSAPRSAFRHWCPVSSPRGLWLGLFYLGALMLYVLLALIFPQSVARCGSTLAEHPGRVILIGLLSLVALPILFILLLITVIGIPVALFLLPLAVLGLCVWGKAGVYALVGQKLTRGRVNTALSVLVGGGLVVLLLVLVPILGLIVSMLLSVLGFSCAMDRAINSMQKQGTAPTGSGSVTQADPTTPTNSSPIAPAIVPPVLSAETSLFRAEFWIRMAALLIDVFLVSLVCMPFAHVIRMAGNVTIDSPGLLPLLALYGALMWKLRGTTIGGIIFDLKVVRVDGQPMDWTTVIVRALGCFLSLMVIGLGFLWIAFDAEKLAWHDKIAGTIVVRAKTPALSSGGAP